MILRPCIVVPTYNNGSTIQFVVEKLLSETSLNVFVIDDGSDSPVADLLTANARLSIIRHAKNFGKGKALQTGFQECLRRGFTHVLTFDGDGQHLTSEAKKLLEAMEKDPWDLIIGARDLQGKDVPSVSRFGRLFSNFWVKYETEIPIRDSQSGLRIYPLFHLQTMRFFTTRYDFEIEVLIRLLWKGVKITEVPVEVSYDPKVRVSHFKKGRDNFRISVLNIVLVLFSLLKGHHTSTKASLAFALGIFIGTTPFIGFHTLIAFLFALVFRLNFPLVWVGTQISLPPLMPFVIGSSIHIGKQFSSQFFSQWLFGSFVLGGGFSIAGFFIAKSIYSALHRKAKSKSAWTGKMRGGKFGNWFLKKITQVFGIQVAYLCLYFIVPYFYFFSPTGRKGSLEYLRILYPNLSWLGRHILVLKHYHQFGKVLLDRVLQTTVEGRHFQTLSEGAENIIAMIESKRGAVLLGAHVGSWTLAAHYMQFKKEGLDFHTVEYQGEKSQKQYGEAVRKIFANLQTHAVLDIQKVLQNGLPVGMMGDRPTSRRYELTLFLGKLALIDTTPFRLAATLQIPVLFTFGFKDDDNVYRFYCENPKYYSFDAGRSKEDQLLQWAGDFTQVLESYVRRYPLQWFNFYPFFSKFSYN